MKSFIPVCLALAGLSGFGCQKEPPAKPSAPSSTNAASSKAPRKVLDCQKILADIDTQTRFHERRFAEKKGTWLELERVALGYLSRAHLSGRQEDLEKADDAITKAFEVAPENVGPFLVRARINFTLHRFERVEPDLKKAESALLVKGDVRRTIAELRADLLFLRGEYAAAKAEYDRLLQQKRTVTVLARAAQYAWKTGDFDRAEQLLAEAAKMFSPRRGGESLAWVELQRGLLDLDRGRLDDAMAHYRVAEAALPGWYLVEEHIAEILTETGKLQPALHLYEDVVARTESPELTAALAGVLDALGKKEAAQTQLALARTRWAVSLQRFPESAYGHAIEFFLEHGPAEEAVQLARKNHDLRPAGEAKVLLAQALLRAGKIDEAEKLINAALATVFRSAALHATASWIHQKRGRTEPAEASARAASAIDPGAVEAMQALLSSSS